MLERLKHYLIFNESALKLYVLATLTGLLASGVIIAFRLMTNYAQLLFIPSGRVEDYASLPWYWILTLPIIGGIVIGIMLNGLSQEQRSTGVVHVIVRLASYEGRLPWQNALRQLFGASIALITGHSVGREGPSVHLGAASGSLCATALELPNNTVRIMVASGAAAAIAASFNTPIAGVIFAMEVIMMEYHIASFIPIILASVTGAVVCRMAFGPSAVFGYLSTEMHSLWEIPYIILLGILLGFVATAFIHSLRFFSTFMLERPFWMRTTFAGILIGIAGLMMPDAMGMSYNMISTAQLHHAAVGALFALMLLKLVFSSACIGLGIPGGLIGPTIVIGASGGAAMGMIGQYFFPDFASSTNFYAMIGMCAMMAATLKAPLAALMALIEMTANPHIILPGMLAMVFSSLISQEVFKQDGVFMTLLRARGLDFRNDPISQTLRRISVSHAMQRNFEILPRITGIEEATIALNSQPDWILIKQDREPVSLLPAADLARAIHQIEDQGEDEEDELDLMQIPANRRNVHKLSLHSSLHEAQQALSQHHVEALYITRHNAPMIERIYGVLTRENIESHYRVSPTTKSQRQ